MSEQHTICPYTGLRSFTEEESLYFKGRDLQVDQLTALLEQNKFLMVTGASGEGKSSLIFAGLIPNARAGFFKAKYTNWVVADFRPERSPLHNMAQALAKTFERNAGSIETELRRGFSSLIDLYCNSEFYIDESDPQWQQLPDDGKMERKRKAANLMILVDQFEEFFTNPENFYREAPSQDSQVLVNLVLETARIAIKRNIPVYIVCTMRSDYIGQCSAFRGLPEYIGFSQFFVPRLKRKDLKQVIEEPAILSGNRISQRLIERLVYDIAEGVDQLPILQHALSQVWLAAQNGREEMDLLHYAMVGGMPAHELPDEMQVRFHQWFEKLPASRKALYEETGLHKVIEIHANVLYEKAWQDFNSRNPEHPLTRQDAKRIIALTFSCLTKIDNSRAVRNRMTLEEITSIIHSPVCTPQVVGDVLGIYREDGNSFIRPFKTADPSTHTLSPDTVLDITHESLIRNWNKLNTWANREFEYYSTYLDFKKQLDRWKSSGKSSGFLLPIGPLTYFENWYQQCKPNVGWIRRYAEIQDDPVKANAEAETELAGVKEFLKRSARKVRITRAFMKYGAQRIAIVVAVAAMLGMSAFYVLDAARKQNGRVVRTIKKELISLMQSREVGWDIKSVPLVMLERHQQGALQEFLSGLPTRDRVKLARETCRNLLIMNKKDSSVMVNELLRITSDGFKELLSQQPDYGFLLPELNKFTSMLAYYQYYHPTQEKEKMLSDFTSESKQVAAAFFRDSSLYKVTLPAQINYGLQQWLTFGNATATAVHELLLNISPFDSAAGLPWFNKYYPKGKKEDNERTSMEYNGGYHLLASLYAVQGDTTRIRECLDRIRLVGDHDYFTGLGNNNFTNILAILYQYGHRDKTASLLAWIRSHYPDQTALVIYKNAVNRSGYITDFYKANITADAYYYPNLCMGSRDLFNALSDDYEQLIRKENNPSERNYLMAIQKKRRAIYLDKYAKDRRIVADSSNLNRLLEEAMYYYRQVDPGYREMTVPVTLCYNRNGLREKNYKRKHLFVYPDYMDGWFSGTYHTDLFFRFIDRKGLYSEFYTTAEDWGMLHQWIAAAFQRKPFLDEENLDNRYPLADSVLSRILEVRDLYPKGESMDPHLLYLVLANRYFNRGDTGKAYAYYRNFDRENFAASREKYEYLEQTFFLNQLKDVCAGLAASGHTAEATALAEKFEKPHEKIFAYIAMADRLYKDPGYPQAFVYLDSVFSKKRELDSSRLSENLRWEWQYRYNLARLLSRIGGKDLNREAAKLVMELREEDRSQAIAARAEGIAREGNYYQARQALVSTLTQQEDLMGRTVILLQACQKNQTAAEAGKWKFMDENFTTGTNYIFYRPF